MIPISEVQATEALELIAACRDDLLQFCAVMVALAGLWLGYVVISDILDVLWVP